MISPVRFRPVLLGSVLLTTALLAGVAAAQAPAAPSGAAAPSTQQSGARPMAMTPKNLKVLPKDISGEHLIGLMRQYAGGLGVECGYCHAQNPETKRNDFASDANPMKDTARYMITMTADLNDKYLENLPGRRYGDPITCGTCHQGHSHPQVFVPAPRQGPGGAPAGPAGPGGATAPGPKN